jgi:Tfp pilus assembly protein FimT
MLVVIGILGILMGMAGLSGKKWLDRYRVESQTKEMYADLMNARARAMQRNRMHFVALTTSGYTVYEDTNDGPDGNGTPETEHDKPRIRKDIPSNPFEWNGGGSYFIFDTRGFMSGSERSVWVSDGHGSGIQLR